MVIVNTGTTNTHNSIHAQWIKLLKDVQQTVLGAFIEKKEIKVNLKYNPQGKRNENK